MIAAQTIDKIRQKKMDALAAKHLHVPLRHTLTVWIRGVDFLALGVPILYFVIRFFAKGTTRDWIVELIWEIVAAVLLVSAIQKLTGRWEEKAQQHSELIVENLALVRQADALLENTDATSPDAARQFLELADRIEKSDLEALAKVSAADKQSAYREGLKEFQPGAITPCPNCGSSPWQFIPGDCSLCGNVFFRRA